MCVIVCCPLANPIEMVISALEGAVFWQQAQMPLADQRRAIAWLLQQRRQSGSIGRQSHIAPGQRFVQPDGETVLVPTSDEGSAGCRTDCGVRISLQESHTFCSQVINVRSAEIRAPIATYICISQIVCHDENNIGRRRLWLTKNRVHARSQSCHSQRRSTKYRTAGEIPCQAGLGLQLVEKQSCGFTCDGDSGDHSPLLHG